MTDGLPAEAEIPMRDAARPLRVAFVCNHSFGLMTLYRGLFPHLRAQGIACEAVVGDGEYLDRTGDLAQVPVHVVPMERKPAPLRDLVTLAQLVGFFARHRYDVVHVSTPKAAFLGAIAARLTGHRDVLFVVRTRIYEQLSGFERRFYETADWLTSKLSRVVAPIGREMGEAMIADGLCPRDKIRYFGKGSSNGINVERFSRTPEALAQAAELRRAAGIPEDAIVLLSVGRLARGKGLDKLPVVLDRLAQTDRKVWLIVAGPQDSREPTERAVLEDLMARPNVVPLGYQADPVPLYAAADLFLFPSMREGFGNVALEAQAMGLPVIGFDTYGVRESVEDGVTGLLAPFGDAEAFAARAMRLVLDDEERAAMRDAAVARIRRDFANALVWHDLRRVLLELART